MCIFPPANFLISSVFSLLHNHRCILSLTNRSPLTRCFIQHFLGWKATKIARFCWEISNRDRYLNAGKNSNIDGRRSSPAHTLTHITFGFFTMGLCPASLFFVFVSGSHSSFKVTYVSACTASGAGDSFVVFLLCGSKK